jgi:hypothetical protein
VLVVGCGDRRIADATCSATTLRRRRDEWITAGVGDHREPGKMISELRGRRSAKFGSS